MKLNIPANLPVKKFEKNWQFCIGSCHASTLLRKDTLEILKRVHDELGIKRVRFHGTFNDDMNTLSSFKDIFGIDIGKHMVETNFYKIGLLYDNILSIGMQPFVEISFMPELLAKDPKRSFIYGSIHSLPESYDRWYQYIQDYLRYLFHRYGEAEIKQWFFEVWNEPDLGMFFTDSKDGYMQLYETTARAIKDFCPDLRVGGPATAMSRWVPEFLAYCKAHDVPVDFVSTHQYLGEPFIGVSGEEAPAGEKQQESAQEEPLAARVAKLDAAFQNLPADTPLLKAFSFLTGGKDQTEQPWDRDLLPKNAAIVKEQAQGLPVYYTEWNLSSHFGVRSQDSRKVAAYQVRTALAIDGIVEGNSVWCCSDIFEELHQFKEPFHGGYGLLTYTGIPKPQFFGLRMLAQAGDQQLLLDESQFTEVEAAAFESETEKQILLFRENPMQLDLPKEEVEITVALPAAPKRVYLQRIDEDHCNPRKVWEEMGSPNDLTPAEVRQIMAASDMVDEEIPFGYEKGVLQLHAELGVNDIWFIRIEK